MTESAMGEPERQDSPGNVLSDEQRATLRSAGFWMAIIGWAEVLFGAVAGAIWLLAALGAIPGEALGGPPSDRVSLALQVVAALGIGVLTLITARSFRRAGCDRAAGLPAVTAAVADLAELYERQVWVLFVLVAVAIGGVVATWW